VLGTRDNQKRESVFKQNSYANVRKGEESGWAK
jgi:hypothetical protein